MRSSRQLVAIFGFVALLVLAPGCMNRGSAGPLHLDLAVSPDRPSMDKPLTFRVHVSDAGGKSVSGAEVSGALTMKLMDMGATQLKFVPKGNGDYQATVRSVDMSGPWSVAVKASHGGASAKQSFDVNIFD